MNLQLNEDRRMLADTLNRFLAERYDFDVRSKIASSAEGFNRELWQHFAELGIIGALFKEADGGFAGQGLDIVVVFKCLGRGLVVEPFLGALMVGQAIAKAGSGEQKKILAKLIDGSVVAAFAHDEPGTHYELTAVTTRATRKLGSWILKGAKAVVQQGQGADVFLVSARTSGADNSENGISFFLVPKNTAGVTVCSHRKSDGGRIAEITLDGVRVGADALLGKKDAGFEILEYSMGFGVLALCAEALGAMDVAKDHTLEYLRTRKQFGAPIGSFQALQHRMADLLLEIEQARSAVLNAATHISSAPRLVRERSLAAAKYSIGHIGTLVAEECIQLHGGMGMTWELPMAHYAKRLIMIDHQLGDEDHHLERYIALTSASAG